MPTPRARDRGSATVYAALLAGLLTALAGAVLALGAAILARHRAGTAADLAALSAAVHADAGDKPCDWARRVAAGQRAHLVRCACDGQVCVVEASVGTPWGAATVTSRAGPADSPLGPATVGVARSGAPESDPVVVRSAPITPRSPPGSAPLPPLVPAAPPVVLGWHVAETEPLARASAAA